MTWWRPDGTRCCTTDFVHGAPYGSYTRYHEGGEVSREGAFEDDDPVGIIEYLDGAGKVIAQIDTGKPADLEATQAVLNAEEGLAPLAQELLTAQQLGAGLFALARAVGREEASAEQLEQKLAELQEAPDLSFIQMDENAFWDTLYFSAKAEIDLLGEHQEDDGG